jgi:transcriptional regulatory protein RtcR
MRKRGARRAVHKEARDQFLKFAESTSAQWTATFRDLNAAVTRMATLSLGGRIKRTIEGLCCRADSREVNCAP